MKRLSGLYFVGMVLLVALALLIEVFIVSLWFFSLACWCLLLSNWFKVNGL